MNSSAEAFKHRTQEFALRIIRLVESLPEGRTADILGRQLLRCSTSVGANYRAACRARSKPEFRAKLGIVEEEADECIYWIELLIKANVVREELVQNLMQEADEITAIIVSSIKSSKQRNQNH